MLARLTSHPSTPCEFVDRIEIQAERLPREELRLSYRIRGDLTGLALAAPGQPLRTDGLWRHTCCELFLKAENRPEYFEFNFAPSKAWALYRFSGYRKDMAAMATSVPPSISPRHGPRCFELGVRLDLKPFGTAGSRLQLALAAVIETRHGALSYWALRHPHQCPDFHHPDAYALELAP